MVKRLKQGMGDWGTWGDGEGRSKELGMKSHIEVYYLIPQLKKCKGGGNRTHGKRKKTGDMEEGVVGRFNKKVRIYEKSHGN